MCESVTEALAAGDRLTVEQTGHLAGCARCQGVQRLVAGWRPARVSAATRLEVPRVRQAARLRRVRTGLAFASVAAAVALLFLWPRPALPPEPDLFAVLEEADALLGDGDPMDAGALDALFEPDFETFDLGDL